MESELEVLGATGVEDKLQEGVPETLETLRAAGVKVKGGDGHWLSVGLLTGLFYILFCGCANDNGTPWVAALCLMKYFVMLTGP